MNKNLMLILFALLANDAEAKNPSTQRNNESKIIYFNPPYQQLKIHGINYQNSCSSQEQEKLESSASFIKNKKSKDAVLGMIKVILCAKTNAFGARFLLGRTSETVYSTSESTGEEVSITTKPKSIEMVNKFFAEAQAWNALLEHKQNGIFLSYASSEYCIKTIHMENPSHQWLITGYSEACD